MQEDLRRTTRLDMDVPVELSFVDEQGNDMLERTTTISIDKYGARVRSKYNHKAGSEIVLGLPHLGRGTNCRVVRCLRARVPGPWTYEVGIEMEPHDDAWPVPSPPEDWAPKVVEAPPAGDVLMALDTLIDMLEERRVLTRQDFLKRLEK